MRLKKRWISLLAAAMVALNVMPVAAAETEEATAQLNVSFPAGDTTVTAKVAAVDAGNVSYVISIPSRVDFGTLTKPASGDEAYVTATVTVKLAEVSGLDESTQRVAVFVQDSVSGTKEFRLTGQDTANAGKELTYSIRLGEAELNATNGSIYPNGFLVGAFKSAGNIVDLTLALDQQQLNDPDYTLDQWAGNYKGTLSFYSKVASVNDYN